MVTVTLVMLLPLLFLTSANQDAEDSEETFNPYETYTYGPMEPVFLPTPRNITVREGGTAILPCSIQHLGTKKVAWRRVDRDEFLTIGDLLLAQSESGVMTVSQVTQKGDVTDWNLIIHKVTPLHAGIYECQITATAGYFKHIQINVVGPAIREPGISLTGTDFVERGEKIELVCNATGGTQIAEDVDWFKDGNIIDATRRRHRGVVIVKYRSLEDWTLVSTLQIEHAEMDDAGTYVCRSSYNKLGDFMVNVLAAETNNVKRGTNPSSSTGHRAKVRTQHTLGVLICCCLVLGGLWSGVGSGW